MTTKQSLIWTIFYVFCAVLFAGYIFCSQGAVPTMQFLTVFSLEKLLSMDNLLVMFLIFKFFGLDQNKQKNALRLGIIGAFAFRAALIFSGTYIVAHLQWLLFGFAAFLIYSGYKMIFGEDDEFDPADSKIVSYLKTKTGTLGVFMACVCAIELCDIIFAVDSIPASFGVTQDPFIIMSANIFAVLGLRSLYFAVANGIAVLTGIEKWIGGVLAIVGVNVLVSHLWIKIPDAYVMAAVAVLLITGAMMCNKENAK